MFSTDIDLVSDLVIDGRSSSSVVVLLHILGCSLECHFYLRVNGLHALGKLFGCLVSDVLELQLHAFVWMSHMIDIEG